MTAARPRLAAAVLLGAGAVLAGTAVLALSGYLISRAAQRPDILALTAVITAVRGLSLLRAGLRYGERLVSHDLALVDAGRLRARFLRRLIPLGGVLRGRPGRADLTQRFVADVDTLGEVTLRGRLPILVAAVGVLAVGIAVAVLSFTAGAGLVLGLALTSALILGLRGRLLAGAIHRQAPARSELARSLLEALSGAVELAVAGRARARADELEADSRRLSALGTRDALGSAAATAGAAALSGLTLVVVLLLAIPAVHAGALSPLLLAGIALAVLGVGETLAPLPGAALALQRARSAGERLARLDDLQPPVSDPAEPRGLRTRDVDLVLEDVAVSVDPDGAPLFHGVTLALDPGCRVALTGPSGAGKSTLATLLVRFRDPDEGRVLIGGVDARALALADVRATTVLIAQDAHLFRASVRANLLLARPEASESELWAALEVVDLAAWVRELPAGLDTLCGEDGAVLSGGQRQRLCVARALISQAPFIVLDEPTAHLDPLGAERLMARVSAAAGPRGLLVITHRPEGLAAMDRVLCLDRGDLGEAPRCGRALSPTA